MKETGGILEPMEVQCWQLLHAHPKPYTREQFEDTYQWMMGRGLVMPKATCDEVADNQAWQWPRPKKGRVGR